MMKNLRDNCIISLHKKMWAIKNNSRTVVPTSCRLRGFLICKNPLDLLCFTTTFLSSSSAKTQNFLGTFQGTFSANLTVLSENKYFGLYSDRFRNEFGMTDFVENEANNGTPKGLYLENLLQIKKNLYLI